MNKLVIKNEQETKEFGLKLADRLRPGSLVALIGDLGTGKTALTKYIAQGLGIQEAITSPTFTIVQEYHQGRLPLYHFDVYRVSDPDELFEIGYEEYFFGQGVSVVEWADLILELLPEEAIVIRIAYGSQEGERIYDIEGLEAAE
ncbi:tRNA (adenosine(37)-N6)-threonylcarbamoyltransferase complex ATPase subunit type 1 TsaE [Aminipila butyrica]|uniref:tRNA threonylcarbamoyladenosine biosynthesis protein TsaE n=1 Tax=Aminipila butyrica TaxID=433296 RepID=A0A858BZ65_9FIRM|nr:tRNA (adenosine(37)-N6)-threonylcarbamoyltransferase complex ATPase subunit type 1 TsaE [Aminipila butyrica]QIB70408.1 tRNA (adenosine(37)-N6)-threonylcarbamoyltransferase complex ATPase subunit type 1 TsaE [Aminipila butyrica]